MYQKRQKMNSVFPFWVKLIVIKYVQEHPVTNFTNN